MKRELQDRLADPSTDAHHRDAATARVKLEGGAEAARFSAPQRIRCPYLDTIDRSSLDFDLYKECSVTLERENVYICLVCGQYLKGRGRNTPAFTHSVQMSHHVFLNIRTEKFYCLPDNYEVVDTSLGDIIRALNPRFQREQIAQLDRNTVLSRDRLGVSYLPGFVGLNNLKRTDYMNVVLQLLAHVRPLRDLLLGGDRLAAVKAPLVHRLSEVVRKMWNPDNFKNCVGPHELLAELVRCAPAGRFRVGEPYEAVEFMTWLLQSLHKSLVAAASSAVGAAAGAGSGGAAAAAAAASAKPRRKAGSGRSAVTDAFQGEVEVREWKLRPGEGEGEGGGGAAAAAAAGDGDAPPQSVKRVPFLLLSIELPAAPLFKDSQGSNIIPQVPLFSVIGKYDGETDTHDVTAGVRRRYRITKLPRYLVLHMKRFKRNNFFVEKNPTIVTFPLKNLEMKPYVDPASLAAPVAPAIPTSDAVAAMGVAELKALCARARLGVEGIVELAELRARAADAAKLLADRQQRALPSTKYDLIVNVVHDSLVGGGGGGGAGSQGQKADARRDPLDTGAFRCHVLSKGTEQWYEMSDLHVQEVELRDSISVSESYMLVYERKDA